MIDFEASLFMHILKLKEEKNKYYSLIECDPHIAYVFKNFEEYKSYFNENGFPDIDEDLLNICRMKTTSSGSVIALKGICDHAITRYRQKYIQEHPEEYPEFGTEAMTEKLEEEYKKYNLMKRKDFELLTDDFKHHV